MKFRDLKRETKEELKQRAAEIALGKPLRKPSRWATATKEEKAANDKLYRNRITYRHMHIAYCEFFNNTPYAMIENPRKGNEPNKNSIKTYKNFWEEEIDEVDEVEAEALRDCA